MCTGQPPFQAISIVASFLPASPSASREPVSRHPTPVERPHPRSPLAHRRPLDQSTHPTRVHFGSRPARPKWAHTTVSFPGCPARGWKSALSVTLNWALPPPTLASHLLFHHLSRRLLSTAVVRPPNTFFFESYASFSPFTPLDTVPVVLSLLPLLFSLSSFHGLMGRKRTAKEYNRTA